MSTATAFKFFNPFPLCPQDISGTVPASSLHVDNLSLADAMAFYWNLESLTLTLVGTTTLVAPPGFFDCAGRFTLSPIASSVCDSASNSADCAWYGPSFSTVPFASFPDITQPMERVCDPATDGRLLAIQVIDSVANEAIFIIQFWLGTDPVNSGKYRIYYRFVIERQKGARGGIDWRTDPTPPFTYSALTSGVVTIGGLSMTYYSSYRSSGGQIATGGTMSASSSSFTY